MSINNINSNCRFCLRVLGYTEFTVGVTTRIADEFANITQQEARNKKKSEDNKTRSDEVAPFLHHVKQASWHYLLSSYFELLFSFSSSQIFPKIFAFSASTTSYISVTSESSYSTLRQFFISLHNQLKTSLTLAQTISLMFRSPWKLSWQSLSVGRPTLQTHRLTLSKRSNLTWSRKCSMRILPSFSRYTRKA